MDTTDMTFVWNNMYFPNDNQVEVQSWFAELLVIIKGHLELVNTGKTDMKHEQLVKPLGLQNGWNLMVTSVG